MTAQSIVCGACAAEVPSGRLSCPSCGELLASVAGSRRTAASAVGSVAARPTVPDVLYEPASAPMNSVVAGQLALDPSTNALLDDDTDDLPAWTPQSATVPWGTASDLNGGRTPPYMPRPGLRQAAATAAPAAHASPDEVESGWTPEPDIDLLRPPAPSQRSGAESSHVGGPAAWGPELASVAWAAPQPVAVAATAALPQAVEGFAGPGAYLPPAPVAVPAGPSAPAREWAGHTAAEEGAAAGAIPEASAVLDGDLRTRLLEFVKWLSVAGAAFAAVGFLLPWGQVVIGSADTGYFGRWGIAGPWHLLIALAILAD